MCTTESVDLFLYYSTTAHTCVSCQLHFCCFLSLPFCCHSLRFWHPFAPLISGAPQESLLRSASVCLCFCLCERIFVSVSVWVHLLFCACVCEVSQSCEVTDLSAKLPLLSHQTLTCASVSFVRILVDIIQNSHSLNMSQNFTLNPSTGLWREWGPKMVITLHIKKTNYINLQKEKRHKSINDLRFPLFFCLLFSLLTCWPRLRLQNEAKVLKKNKKTLQFHTLETVP